MDELTAFAQTNTAQRLRAAAANGTLSHALIFSGGGNRRAAALYAAAAMECESARRPCLSCPACRKVTECIHPDVQFVRDDAHAEIAIDVVRNVRTDAFIRPNEGRRKVYIFEDCTMLNDKDQNVLLKVVEEGPPYAAFLFCAENPNELLQTIRSRCVELKLAPDEEAMRSERPQAVEFCRLLPLKKRSARTAFLVKMENSKCKREELAAFLEDCRFLLTESLKADYGIPGDASARDVALPLSRSLTKAQILGTIELLQRYEKNCHYNIGVGPALGGLAVELEEIL